MVIYEVNLNVQGSVAGEYREWLREHIEQMLGFDGFLGARWLEDMEPPAGDDPNGAADSEVRWVVQYHLRDRESLDHYLANHAPAMRRDGLERFPGKFTATRRILKDVGEEILDFSS